MDMDKEKEVVRYEKKITNALVGADDGEVAALRLTFQSEPFSAWQGSCDTDMLGWCQAGTGAWATKLGQAIMELMMHLPAGNRHMRIFIGCLIELLKHR